MPQPNHLYVPECRCNVVTTVLLSGNKFQKLLRELILVKRLGTSMTGAHWPGYQAQHLELNLNQQGCADSRT